jgi:nucleoside-diphosphate-sugar epimerase
MNVLFIGGNGNISWHCTHEALKSNHEVWALNREVTIQSRRAFPAEVKKIRGDIRNHAQMKELLKDMKFDVVCDFICYNGEHAKASIKLFRGKIMQYIFISSTANYYRQNAVYPLKENTYLYSDWVYAQNKILAEKIFLDEFRKNGFPVTIVRPGQTYDTLIPDAVGNSDWTIANRILNNKPIVLFGDGTNLWTLTHARDFSKAFIYLIGNSKTIGEAYHITSDELLTWRQITFITSEALGVDKPRIIYLPTSYIEKINPQLASGILWHKMWCDIYDNSKIKNIAEGWYANIKFLNGIRESINWLLEEKGRQRINYDLDNIVSILVDKYQSC